MQILSYAGGGYEGELVKVEVDLRRGIPGMDIVGLPDNAVRESRERVRAAIRNSGFRMPRERILINLAPAGVKKIGTAFDMSIATALLFGAGQLPAGLDAKLLVVGELGLSGQVRGVPGVLGAIISAQAEGAAFFIVPEENMTEARVVGGRKVLAVSRLEQVPEIFALLLHGRYSGLDPADFSEEKVNPARRRNDRENGFDHAFGSRSERMNVDVELDFADIKGQEKLKRACEIAAAGRHHLLLFGPPGAGKTMAAFRFPGLLPPLGERESIEVSRIHSIGGKLPEGFGLIRKPPFRVPHHTASREGMIGGGAGVLPGEISYAHNGILFLDETMQFSTSLLQSLREPIEHGIVRIARSGHHYWYPARFQLILAMNPCPCGKMGQPGAVCMCSPLELHRYWKKLGAAFLDRIDIRVPVEPLQLLKQGKGRLRREIAVDISEDKPDSGALTVYREAGGGSEAMRKRVTAAIDIQHGRFEGRHSMRNAEMGPGEVEKFCHTGPETARTLNDGISMLGLSYRAGDSVLKIARTIADLGGRETISEEDILEALSLRRFGDGDYFWKKAG